jgi:hypothetical protein
VHQIELFDPSILQGQLERAELVAVAADALREEDAGRHEVQPLKRRASVSGLR